MMHTTESEPLFLTPREVADELGVSTDELRAWRESGVGPKFVVITRRTIYYWRVEVIAFKASRDAR